MKAEGAGKKINLLNVYKLEQIDERFVEKNKLTEVIISIQNIDPSRLLDITTHLFTFDIKVKIVPPVQTWIDGDLSIGQIQDVRIEDLLGRDPVQLDLSADMSSYLGDRVVMVTGAGGSIGAGSADSVS